MKKLLITLLSLSAASSFAFAPSHSTSALTYASLACPQAASTADGGFCPSFKSVAQCQCVSRGLPAGECQDMNLLYSRMVAMFGTVDAACQYQADTTHDTTKQICVDDWNCYRSGGRNSQGQLCSSTGRSC